MTRQLVLTGILSLVLSVRTTGQNLKIYHIDVDQADATLFVSPSGKTMLVDCGKNGHGARVAAVMEKAGLHQVDYFVSTHYHEDHYGGIDELVATIPVVNSYDRGDKEYLPPAKLNDPDFKNYQSAVGARAAHLMRGETIPFDPAVSVTCIAKGGVVLGEAPALPGAEENDMSIALLIQYGRFRYFIGGDIGHPIESKVAARHLVTGVDIYHADHHGSEKSTDSALMDDAQPSVVVISNGDDAVYQHPRQAILTLFDTLSSHPLAFQTNKYLHGGKGGNVADERIGDLQAVNDDGTILVIVDTVQGKYTVSCRGVQSEFRIKGAVAPAPMIVVESLVPDPVGPDADDEEVVVRNKGGSVVSLVGWFLRDASGKVWTLSSAGNLDAGSATTIKRNGMAMTLNNNGDEITLLDVSNVERDKFAYPTSREGVRIVTGH